MTHPRWRIYIVVCFVSTTCCVAQAIVKDARLDLPPQEGVLLRSEARTLPDCGFAPQDRTCFEENQGQIRNSEGKPCPDVLYVARMSRELWLFFGRDRISYVFRAEDSSVPPESERGQWHMHPPVRSWHTFRADIIFRGANVTNRFKGVAMQSELRRYYIPHSERGIEVHTFRSLVYRNIYPGIDLVYRVDDRGVKYDFVVSPGADVSDIRLEVKGARNLKLGPDGGLQIETPLGTLEDGTPATYQCGEVSPLAGESLPLSLFYRPIRRTKIEARWNVAGMGATLQVLKYDTRYKLIIDPRLSWSTLFGGSSWENTNFGWGKVACDAANNVVVCGWTSSTDLPVSVGALQKSIGGGNDGFIAKYDPSGNRLWSTYIGGNADDEASDVCIDSHADIIVVGHTSSTDFPVTSSGFQTASGGGYDVWILKCDSSGARDWSTYFGGSGDETTPRVAIDKGDNIVLTGSTRSNNLPTTKGCYDSTYGGNRDAFVLRVNADCKKIWATYLGGVGEDQGMGIKISGDYNIACVVHTGSNGLFTSTSAFQKTRADTNQGGPTGVATDAYVLMCDSGFAPLWATYYSGSNQDQPEDIATDANGNLAMCGRTASSDFPISPGAYQSAFNGASGFLVAFSSTGARQWGTYVDKLLHLYSCAFGTQGDIWVAGTCASGGSVGITADAFQQSYGGGSWDGVLAEFGPSGDHRYGSYVGGTGDDAGGGIAVDKSGGVIITGYTRSSNFPLTPGADQSGPQDGASNAFVMKFCTSTIVGAKATGGGMICKGDGVNLGVAASGGSSALSYRWTPSTGLSSSRIASPIASPESTTTYYVIVGDGECSAFDSVKVVVLTPPRANAGADLAICRGDSVQIGGAATGGTPPYTYAWTPSTGLSSATAARPVARPVNTTQYVVTTTDSNGCKGRDTMVLTVYTLPAPQAGTDRSICRGDTTRIGGAATGGAPPYTYAWSPTTGIASTNTAVTAAAPDSTTTYVLRAVDAHGCVGRDTVKVTVNPLPRASTNAMSDITICAGDSAVVGGPAQGGTPPYKYVWAPATGLSSATAAAPTARPAATTTYRCTITDSNGCTDHAQLTVFVRPAPTVHVTASPLGSVCEGDSVTLTADAGFSSYKWNTGASTRAITVGEAGAYTVTVTNAAGCKATSAPDTVRVTARPGAPAITASGPTAFCAGGSVTLYAGGGAYRSVRWSTGETTTSIVVALAGTYSVTGTDGNGCTSLPASITIAVTPRPAPVITGPDTVCARSTVPYATEAHTGSAYAWSVTGGAIASGQGTPAITVAWGAAGTGTVDVTETSSATCTGAAPTERVNIGSSLVPKILSSAPALCGAGDSVVLDAGAGYATYQWSTGETSRTITVRTAGSYTVSVTDASGCAGTSQPMTIAIGTPPKPGIAGPAGACVNTDAQYAVADVPGDAYAWTVSAEGAITAGGGTPRITVHWNAAGAGTVRVRESRARCAGEDSLAVAVGTSLAPAVTASGPTTFCTGDSVVLTAEAGHATYLWTTGETTRSITVTQSGTYAVTVTDTTGCRGTSAPVTVTVGTTLSPVVTGPAAICPGDSAVLDAGTGYETYQWNTGAATERITVTAAGTYAVSVTKGTCAGTSAPFVVTEYPAPIVAIASQGDTLTATPQAASYEWMRDGGVIAGATGQTYVAAQAGTYTVRVTDTNGCAAISAGYVVPAQSGPSLCVAITPDTLVPGTMATANITLPAPVVSAVDSIVFDLTWAFQAMHLAGMTSPYCTASASERARDTMHIVLTACGVPLPAGELCAARLLGLVVPVDTLRTTIALSNIRFYPFDTAGTAGCSAEAVVVPICGMRGVVFTGETALDAAYPNPATEGAVTVRVRLRSEDAPGARLALYTALGSCVRELTGSVRSDGTVTIDTRELAPGLYICTLEAAGRRFVRPLVVMK